MNQWWVIAAVVVILVLAAIAAALHWQLYKRRLLEKQQRHSARQLQIETERRHSESIRVLARAHSSGQVDSAEACLRIAGLLDILQVEAKARERFVAIDKMRAAIAHIPTQQAWLALPKQERSRFRAEMQHHETQLKEFIDVAMGELHDFEWRS